MNQGYRLDYIMRHEIYRLSRSCRRRDIKRILGMTYGQTPFGFIQTRLNGKRLTYRYNREDVEQQNEEWNIRHGAYCIKGYIPRRPNIYEEAEDDYRSDLLWS